MENNEGLSLGNCTWSFWW